MSEAKELKLKRFDCTQDSTGYELGAAYMEEDPDGDYVRFEDYAASEQRVRELTEQRDAAFIALANCGSRGATEYGKVLANRAALSAPAAEEGKG